MLNFDNVLQVSHHCSIRFDKLDANISVSRSLKRRPVSFRSVDLPKMVAENGTSPAKLP